MSVRIHEAKFCAECELAEGMAGKGEGGMTEEERIIEKYRKRGLPDYMEEAAIRYVLRGVPAGSFLMALLRSDLMATFAYADETNRAKLNDWVMWLYNDVPGGAWGSQGEIDAWIRAGGRQQFEDVA